MKESRAKEVLENAINHLTFYRGSLSLKAQTEWEAVQDAIIILHILRMLLE